MTSGASALCVTIDTAADVAGLALTEGEALLAESTWRSRQSHSRQLLPTLEWLLERAGRTKDDIGAITVCLGPGSYAGLRVGLSTAKTLAYALDVPIAGVGRLEADAWPIVQSTSQRVVAIQVAGRTEIASAAYVAAPEGPREMEAPRLTPRDQFVDYVQAGDIVCGEIILMGEDLVAALRDRGAMVVEAHPARVVAVAQLGWRRHARGDVDNADTLVPLYLRAPAIGPQASN